jgi:hypothetical protein
MGYWCCGRPGAWETALQPLCKEDIRGMNKQMMNDEEKAGNRKARKLAGVLGTDPTRSMSMVSQ